MAPFAYTVRQLRLRPALPAIVILMLALGIGATTAIFSIFHEIILRPLPVPQPDRLVSLGSPGSKWGGISVGSAGDVDAIFSYPMFRDLEARRTGFTGLAGYREFDANVAYENATFAGKGVLVSGAYFDVLGIGPAVGRLIGPQDELRVDESAVAVLSHAYWRNYFGGHPDVIGRTLTVNGHALTIVGVTPAGFFGTTIDVRPQVFVPLTLSRLMQPTLPVDHLENRRMYWLYLCARLLPGVSREQAEARINGVYSGILQEIEAPLHAELPEEVLNEFLERRLTVSPGARGQSLLPDDVGRPLALLLGLTALVLLIVCVNVANLLLARGASRSGELAIRSAIGADRAQLAAYLLAEAAMLAFVGGVASLAVAIFTMNLVAALVPTELAETLRLELSRPALLFAGAMSLATVLLFGLAPAIQASRADPASLARGNATQAFGSRAILRFRTVLVAAQIAFSMVLLVLAGLFTQSLVNVSRVELGMNIESLVAFTVSPRLNGYPRERVMALYSAIEEALAAQPDVRGVGSSSIPLIDDTYGVMTVSVPGRDGELGAQTNAMTSDVSPGFFRTLSIPLLAGRDFSSADRLGSPPVAVVNETFVQTLQLGSDAVGRYFIVGAREVEIVGVVADAKYDAVKGEIPPQYFLPRLQDDNIRSLTFYVRAGAAPSRVLGSIRRVVSGIDPQLPVSNLITMERQVEENVYVDRLIAMLSAAFAVLATLLAAIGLYGVLSYTVARRTREIGVRLALGAAPRQLRAMVLMQVGLIALIGGGCGAVAAIGLGRVAEALLFDLSGYDARVLLAAAAVLAAVVLGASYAPARRASDIAPVEALRYE